MKKHCREYRLAILLLLAANLLAPSNAVGQDFWTSYRDTLKGSWVTEGVIGEGMVGAVVKPGDKFRMTSTFWPALNGKALIGRQTFRIIGRPDYSAQSHYVAGWDPHRGVIDARAYWSDGDVDETTVTAKEGNAFVCEYRFTGGTGTTLSDKAEFVVRDSETLVWSGEETKLVWKRVERGEPSSTIDYVDFYSYFVGQWKVTDEGENPQAGLFTVELGPSGKCHVTRFQLGDRRGEGVYGRDPVTGRWTGTGFEMDGTFWTQVFSPPKSKAATPGMSFTVRNMQRLSDGSKTSNRGKLTIVDENTFTSETPEASLRFSRLGSQALSPHFAKYKILDSWVGDWTTSTTVDGKEISGHFFCRWTPGKSSLTWTWWAPNAAEGMAAEHAYGILGWDPARNQIVEVAFNTNGLTYTTYFEVRENALHGTRHTVMPDGKKFVETMIFTSHPNRIAIKNVERRDEQGKKVPLAFPPEGAFERVR